MENGKTLSIMEQPILYRNTENIAHVFLAFTSFRHLQETAREKEGNTEKIVSANLHTAACTLLIFALYLNYIIILF